MNELESFHSVIDALALGRHWRFWLKGRGWKILGIKGGGGGGGGIANGGSQKNAGGNVNFELKL